jgi:hypothetical protein
MLFAMLVVLLIVWSLTIIYHETIYFSDNS